MACSHNQQKIDRIKGQIKKLEQDLADLNENIGKCRDIKNKHESFKDEINCVMTNLTNNYVKAGESYDGGNMTKCMIETQNTIIDCDNVIKASKEEIEKIKIEIESLNQSIEALQGDCSGCAAAKLDESMV